MTNILSAVRQEVADLLTDAGLPTVATIPDRVTPPIATVYFGSPYIEEDQSVTNDRINLKVRILVRPGTNAVVMQELDDAVVKAVLALKTQHWDFTVSEELEATIGSTPYPCVELSISNWVEIMEGNF